MNTENNKNQGNLSTGTQGGSYEIHVRGQLDESWSDWLEGLEVTLLENGEMILTGHIGDQAALMGVLNRLYDLNLSLLSVNEINKENASMNSTAVQGEFFEIRVKGQLDESWSDWLEGLEVTLLDNGEMILSGYIGDQAALLGTLNKLQGLNLTLLSLSRINSRK